MARIWSTIGLASISLMVLAACSPGGSGPGATPNVLYYFDAFEDAAAPSWLVDGLEGDGHTVLDTSDEDVFDSELADGGFDLVIVLHQHSSTYEIDMSAFQSYVDGGGRAVLADWTMSPSVGLTFDASYSGAENLTTADLAATLSAGVTDPMVLTNPGWTSFSMGLVAETGGTSECTFENADSCLVIGNGGRTALLGFLGDTFPSAGDAEQFWMNLASVLIGP